MIIELTAERRRRVLAAKSETRAKLAKELRYGDLANAEMVEFYESHIEKLNAILKAGKLEV